MRGLRGAVAFLTRIPVTSHVMEPGELAISVRWFPLVGALVGVVVGGTYALGAQWLPSLVAGLIAVLVGVMVTGGLHEDGLGDIADAFGGGSDAADVARILKDPRQGTFGVLAIAGALFLRAGALGSMSPIDGLAMAVAAHVIGRAAVVVGMRLFHPVGDGLAANYSRPLTAVDLVVALGLGIGIGAAAAGIWVAAFIAVALVAVGITGRVSLKKLGGVSGDVLGAIEQVTETAILVLGAAIAHEAWIRPAWWA
jgi:adenosylcobinamide-GDP ribazoletransferase